MTWNANACNMITANIKSVVIFLTPCWDQPTMVPIHSWYNGTNTRWLQAGGLLVDSQKAEP